MRNPEALEHIKVHSESFTCPVSGEVHVYIPEYSFSKEDAIEQQKIQSRSVMADGKFRQPEGRGQGGHGLRSRAEGQEAGEAAAQQGGGVPSLRGSRRADLLTQPLNSQAAPSAD